ncbi:hypothetical protein [Dongia sedimenti]|uniref:Uncharacterized protein n=1 Tax=Dongia sedimenti TaxID=3064282 RepID=A0ABU0YVA0_9PROT|nr:hypothetical protein [Rhodospirillaceae bacterium R-7]
MSEDLGTLMDQHTAKVKEIVGHLAAAEGLFTLSFEKEAELAAEATELLENWDEAHVAAPPGSPPIAVTPLQKLLEECRVIGEQILDRR